MLFHLIIACRRFSLTVSQKNVADSGNFHRSVMNEYSGLTQERSFIRIGFSLDEFNNKNLEGKKEPETRLEQSLSRKTKQL